MNQWMFRFVAPHCIAVALSAAAACAAQPRAVSPPIQPRSAHVVLFDGLPLAPYRKIREVRTVACARELGRDPNIAAARDQLRVEAARRGGNAVGNVMCHYESGPAGSSCWKVAQCAGEVDCASNETNTSVRPTCRVTARDAPGSPAARGPTARSRAP